MSNYPPGVSAGSPRAPWNEPELPTCPACDERIGDEDDHDAGCEWSHMDATDLGEAEEAAHAEMKLEERRLEGRR